ncbi:hypothetical protein RUND412_002322 [Rhizina undulata]
MTTTAQHPSNSSITGSSGSKAASAHDETAAVGVLRATDDELTIESFAHLDEKAILRKMDMRLIPMLAVLYLLSFMDRGNVGNAKIEGMVEDLNMAEPQYNLTLTVFFFSYSFFEVPSNLLLKKLRPSIWLPSIMVAWGTVMTLMGIVKSYHGLLAARFFLGVAEAGLFPGVAYYITMWYCRHEVQYRQALFFSAASVAGAFSGLLAFAIAKMDGVAGLEGWRWIFILEGILTIVVATIAYFVLFDFPETASFLTEEERRFVVWRLKYQGSQDVSLVKAAARKAAGEEEKNVGGQPARVQIAEAQEFSWKYVRDAFSDWQIWLNIIVYLGLVCPLYGISLFLPSIIKELGYTSAKAQLLTIPIYITASILAVIQAYASDKKGIRSPFIFGSFCLMAIGYIMTISAPLSHPGLVYAGVFLAACGLYPGFAGNLAWLSNNLSGSCKRSVGMAMQIGIGNLGGAMASNFYRAQDAPKYRLGHALELGFIGIGMIALVVLVVAYKKINEQREKLEAEGAADGLTPEELGRQGDKAVYWRYVL